MERKSLEEKLVSIQQQFDAQTKVKLDAEAEIFRLQGDYRTVEELLSHIPVEVKKDKKDATN